MTWEESEARKIVTVLFTDVAGSTALGERLDPELLRRIMWRYFETVQGVLERHGGTVEKFIGDAVLAVFGVPAVREDDALRAVRAAAELGDALRELNAELERDHGLELATRTGVNTGEVIVGGGAPDQKLATGDAVNVAARLEQAAAPGDVLLGETTYAAVADAVQVGEAPPIEARGKSRPLVAYRLVALRPDVPAFTRPIATPFVGREQELARLRGAFDTAVATGSAQVATIVGTPGIGKSRLAREVLGSLEGEARILVGRCSSYGEGVPYLPLADVVRDAGDVTELLADVGHGELAARLVSGAVGEREGGGSPDETAWAFRRLFETLAATRPLVVVVDDIQWADAALLDLVEYVVGSSSDAPILALCTARPDLFEVRPSWAAPRAGATLVALEPLDEAQSDELVDALAHGLAPRLRERVVATAEGNPLFVEQLLAHFADDPDADTVPPTIQALLAARIDRLQPEERAVVQRGSVEGRLFHRGAVHELLDDGTGVGGTLLALTHKEFVRPDRSLFPGDDGFRFNHVLIRDVAYASMPKELRSRLHARLADWLERLDGHLAAHGEIVGYHLEQAYSLGAELGRKDGELALRAGRLLRRAGGAALDRAEPASAVSLLRRAEGLLADAPAERAKLLPDLARAAQESGSVPAAEEVFSEAIVLARELGDEHTELRAELGRGQLAYMLGTADGNELRAIAERAIATFENDADLADAWQLMGTAHLRARDRGAQLEALLHAREHALASGDLRREVDAWNQVGGAMIFGRTPLAEIGPFLDEQIEWARARNLPAVEADALLGGPYVDARLGDFELAREKLARSKLICRELGIAYGLAEAGMAGSELETLAGDLPAAERELRGSIELALDMGAPRYVALYQVRLSRVLNDQGRHEQAGALLDEAAELYTGTPWWQSNRARVLAARGELTEAVALAREAADQEVGSDDLTAAALTLVDVAEVLRAAGDGAAAEAALAEAIALNEEKGNVVAAQQCRERLAAR
jgi:class 3 adenylate cyclase